jgi:hypothetical protein
MRLPLLSVKTFLEGVLPTQYEKPIGASKSTEYRGASLCMTYSCIRNVTKRRKGETKEGGEKEAGDREAHAGNRADPATQADAEHSGGSKSHIGAQINRTREKEQHIHASATGYSRHHTWKPTISSA